MNPNSREERISDSDRDSEFAGAYSFGLHSQEWCVSGLLLRGVSSQGRARTKPDRTRGDVVRDFDGVAFPRKVARTLKEHST
jgi:hypothetical protein